MDKHTMVEHDGYVTRDGPDYDKYADAVLDSLQQQGRDFTDPEEAEEEAERMAAMLVLDEETLVEKARQKASAGQPQGGQNIGNINNIGGGA